MTPNIFRWASSELSQDAFICWLLSWANHHESKALNETSKFFIQRLTEGKINDFNKIEVRKQIGNIDILCIIDDNKVILIEDKVHTKNHGNQLERYLENQLKNYSRENIFPVYFKTGDQSNYKAIEKIGYKPFLRNDFLEVLKFGIDSGIQNEIFVDFFHHLREIENSVQSFLNLPVSEWHWDSWKGFYTLLQKELGDGEWDYIPQMNGGFLGFWWNYNWKSLTDEIGYDYYLQLEHNKFCFKLSPEKREHAELTRSHYRNLLYPKAKEHGIEIYQNGRIGQWMTAAALSTPYLIENENGFLDIDATVENIRKIQKMVDEM